MSQDLTPYDAVISDLEAKRDQLTAMIDTLKQMKNLGIQSPLNLTSANTQVNQPTLAHDSFFGMTIPDAAKKYLSIVRTTKTNPELCEALLDGGFKTTSDNFREVVRSTLGRNT
ncbi:MAG TPA: hypothetical protein VH437_04335, partial [Terriglobales bacterium]